MADKRITELTEKQTVESGDFLIVDNGTSGTKKMTPDNLLNAKTTVKTATLAAGSTSVTFTGVPTTGSNLIEVYTSKAGLDYTAVDDTTAGELTYTFDAQSGAVTVILTIKEVAD